MSDGPKPYMGQVMAECDCQHYGCVNRGYCMADRIEALVKDKERLGREVNMARYGQPDFAWSIHKQAMADLQARAERLEAALRAIQTYLQEPAPENKLNDLRNDLRWIGNRARAALEGAKP